MGIWDKFTSKKEQKKSEADLSLKDLVDGLNDGSLDLGSVGVERCLMCVMAGKNNRPTWRMVQHVYCDEHKPMMDQMLRAKKPGGEPPWERI